MARVKDTRLQANEEDEDQWEPEDEVAQLITGFESDGEDEESGDEGFKQGKAIPKLPKRKALTVKEKSSKSSEGPGVIYIGRIPHGFHEHEMRAYFSQFGDVNHVRLSRSKKTGKSKHYAFLEFKLEEVAKIAAKTMDKYLLFGHILRCSFVPQERVHPSLWKGADKRFKSVPWAKIEGRKLAAPKGRSDWERKVDKESKRRASKAEKLKELGYEFEPTELKTVDTVPMQAAKPLEEAVAEEERTIVVAKEGNSVVVSEVIKTKKVKKDKKDRKAANEVSEAPDSSILVEKPSKTEKKQKASIEAPAAAEAPTELKKGKKEKKSKAIVPEPPVPQETKKPKKDKKSKAAIDEPQAPVKEVVKSAKKEKKPKSEVTKPTEEASDLDSGKRIKKPSKRALEAAEEDSLRKKSRKSK